MCYADTMRKPTDPIIRFKNNYVITKNDCWEWIKFTNKGYARFNNGEKIVDAHRWYYQIYKKIKLERNEHLDHLCRNRKCVNPNHLDVVSNKTNWLRGKSITRLKSLQTHCIQGHLLAGENLYVNNNKRRCNKCHAINEKKYRLKKRTINR